MLFPESRFDMVIDVGMNHGPLGGRHGWVVFSDVA